MFGTDGTVTNGFPRLIPFDEVRDGKNYEPSVIREAMLFGTPKQAIERLEGYADLGVDIFHSTAQTSVSSPLSNATRSSFSSSTSCLTSPKKGSDRFIFDQLYKNKSV